MGEEQQREQQHRCTRPTNADRLECVGADQPKHRTVSDGFDTDRACLLIRGFGFESLAAHP